MSAHIQVNYNGEQSAEFWIEKPVLRLGSNESCDVPIRSSQVASHAATIQFRNGGYVVYNRTEAPLTLAERTIAPGESEVWQDQESLLVAPDVSVCLVIQGSAAPSRRARDNAVLRAYQEKRQIERAEREAIDQQQAEEELAARSEAAAGSSFNPQVLVGVACLLLAALMLAGIVYMLVIPPAATTSSNPLDDPQSVATVLLKQNVVDQLDPQLRRALQAAQHAVQRDDPAAARRQLLELQRVAAQLTAEGHSLELTVAGEVYPYEKPLGRYIGYHLARLEEDR